jgi:hypothetical protein
MKMRLKQNLRKDALTRRQMLLLSGVPFLALISLPMSPVLAQTVVVDSTEELKSAKASKTKTIIVKGELAKQLHNAKPLMGLDKGALLRLIPSVLLGLPSNLGAEITLAIVFFGISGILTAYAIYKDYNEVEYSLMPPTLKLRRT